MRAGTTVMTLAMTPLILIAGLAALVCTALLGISRRVARRGSGQQTAATLVPVTRLDTRTADVALRRAA